MNMPLSIVIGIHVFILFYIIGVVLSATAVCFTISDLIKASRYNIKEEKRRKALELVSIAFVLTVYIGLGVALIV